MKNVSIEINSDDVILEALMQDFADKFVSKLDEALTCGALSDEDKKAEFLIAKMVLKIAAEDFAPVHHGHWREVEANLRCFV